MWHIPTHEWLECWTQRLQRASSLTPCILDDDPAQLEAAFRKGASGADAIITTGGVSVGEADFIKQLMAQLGEVLFWKIAMRPVRPMALSIA